MNMKKLYTLISLIVITTINAQAPQGFNYQATVRNSAGVLITNQSVSFKFSILQNSDTGTVVYSENQTTTTDDLGHASLVVGRGTPVTGTFSSINWANGTYYLKIELNTGSGFVAMGTTQLLSVPYALHANTATSTTGSTGGFTHYIGEQFGGGIIFHLWKDSLGIEHGLIVDVTDLSTGEVWSNIDTTLIGPSAQSSWDGLSNSNAIVAQAGHTNSAAALCLNSTNGGQTDWYLPSSLEFNLLWFNYFAVVKTISQISGATELRGPNYWNSTEELDSGGQECAYAHYNRFPPNDQNSGPTGTIGSTCKTAQNYVRAIRSF